MVPGLMARTCEVAVAARKAATSKCARTVVRQITERTTADMGTSPPPAGETDNRQLTTVNPPTTEAEGRAPDVRALVPHNTTDEIPPLGMPRLHAVVVVRGEGDVRSPANSNSNEQVVLSRAGDREQLLQSIRLLLHLWNLTARRAALCICVPLRAQTPTL